MSRRLRTGTVVSENSWGGGLNAEGAKITRRTLRGEGGGGVLPIASEHAVDGVETFDAPGEVAAARKISVAVGVRLGKE